jgi:hypothetical protein
VTPHEALQPEWAAPGPTLYKTIMEEALADSVDFSMLVQFVPEACRAEFAAAADTAMKRLYVRGVASGYEQAVMRFDARESA